MTHHITDEQIVAATWRIKREDFADGHAYDLAIARAVLALAAPQGEPVAWLHWLHGPVRLFMNKDEAEMELDRLNRVYPVNVGDRCIKPLYTSPAVPSDEPAEFERAYNRLFRGRGVDTRHISDCEAVWMARAALTAAPTPPAQSKCLTCNGHGLIGGHMHDGSGYGEGCPDCNPEPAVPELLGSTGDMYHTDDAAVDRFARAMKDKLAESRAKGRSGWDDPSQCSVGHLANLLVEHIPKGDPVDVANFAMMLHERGADPAVLASRLPITVPNPITRTGIAKSMAARFMGWKLPEDFSPDGGILFKKPENVVDWPSGTNLMHVGQAQEMFEYVLEGILLHKAERS